MSSHSASKLWLESYHLMMPNVAAAIIIRYLYPPPHFPPINDELWPNFTRTLMSTEVALWYFLISSATPPPLLGCRFFGSFHHSPHLFQLLGGVFKLWTHAFFVLMWGGRRIMMEIHDGEIWIDPLGWERMKEGECLAAGATCIRFPTWYLNFLLWKP